MSRKEGGRKVGSPLFVALATALIAVTAGLYACSDGSPSVAGLHSDQAAAKERPASPKGNPYAFVGQEHNNELDYVLRQFHKKHRKGMQKKEKCALLDEIVGEYNKGKKRAEYDFRPEVKGALCNAENQVDGQSALRSQIRTASAYEDFSPAALDLTGQIESIMLNSSSAADVAAALGPINSQAQNSLSGNDAALVLAVSSVAQSSAYYWEANFDYWRDAFARDGSTPTPYIQMGSDGNDEGMTLVRHRASFDWRGVRAVGWADVSGGIVGGIRGAFGGPGGVLLGAATGAAYASIRAALGAIIALI